MYFRRLEKAVAERGEAVAVRTADRAYSLFEVVAAANNCAADLHGQGFRRGDGVGVTVRDQCRHLVVTLALMRLGCASVALPSFESVAYRERLARRVGAAAVIGQSDADRIDGISFVLCPEMDGAGTAGAGALPPLPGDDAVALLVVSSGSTGSPKIVPLTARQLYLQSIAFNVTPGRGAFLRGNGIEFNNARRQRLFALAVGTTNLLLEPGTFDTIEACRRFDVGLLALSHPQVKLLLARDPVCGALPPHTHLRLGGANVSPELRRQIVEKLTPNLFVAYATTESGNIATADPSQHEVAPDAVGVVLPGIEVAIEGEDGGATPDGNPGTIRVRGPGIADSYFGDPDMSAGAFRNGWFYPGDRGRLLAGRCLCVEGRVDEMMSLASIKIFPSEIERVVCALPGVLDCAAFSMKSPDFGDIPWSRWCPAREQRTGRFLPKRRRSWA